MSNRKTGDMSKPTGATKIVDFINARLNADGTLTLTKAEVSALVSAAEGTSP